MNNNPKSVCECYDYMLTTRLSQIKGSISIDCQPVFRYVRTIKVNIIIPYLLRYNKLYISPKLALRFTEVIYTCYFRA